MCIALCQAARGIAPLPPVRIAHVGGAAVPEGVAQDFERTFGGDVVEGYGLTELSGIATTFPVGRRRKPGSVGVPLGGTALGIRDPDDQGVGEVMFRGPSVIPGYWNDPEATAAAIDADGWLATGDMGRVDDEGDLFLVDRKKELIIRGGYNVYPREVEEALYSHPGVLEAAVVGVPDETLGRGGRGARRSASRLVASRWTTSGRGAASASRRTSTRAASSSSTSFRKARPGRS